MRVLPVPLLVLALLAAGCLDSNHSRPGPAPMASTTQGPGPEIPIPGTNATYRWENGSAPAPADGPSYWLVRVTGLATAAGHDGVSCDRGFTFHANATARELFFDPRWHPFDPELVDAMVAADVDDQAGCPVAHRLHPNHDNSVDRLGPLGDALVTIDAATGEARVFLGESIELRLQPGQAIRLSAEEPATSAFASRVLIEHHGAWPRSGLRAIEHSAYW